MATSQEIAGVRGGIDALTDGAGLEAVHCDELGDEDHEQSVHHTVGFWCRHRRFFVRTWFSLRMHQSLLCSMDLSLAVVELRRPMRPLGSGSLPGRGLLVLAQGLGIAR